MFSNQPSSNEKLHYESLISLFKYAVTVLISLIGMVGLIIGYLTYSNGQEMRESMDAERKSFNDNINEMKTDLKEKEREMQAREKVLQEKIEENIKESRELVISTGNQAIYQIGVIKDEATQIAKIEAQNKINKVFDDKNFDEFVSQIAKNRIEPQINSMVDIKIEKFNVDDINLILDLIESKDDEKVSAATNYLTSKPNRKLNNAQVERILLILSDNSINVDSRMEIANVLQEYKSPQIINFFKSQLLPGKSLIYDSALHYLLRSNIPQDFKLYSEFIEKLPDKNTILSNFVYYARTDKQELLSILNSTEIVNVLIRSSTKAELKEYERSIKSLCDDFHLPFFEISKSLLFFKINEILKN